MCSRPIPFEFGSTHAASAQRKDGHNTCFRLGTLVKRVVFQQELAVSAFQRVGRGAIHTYEHATTIKHSVAIVLDRVATRRTERRTGSDCPVLVLEADTFLDLSIDRATPRPPVRIRATVLPACGLRTAAVACLAVFANKALDFLHTLVVAVQCHNASERKRLVKQLVNWARANAIAMRTVWLLDPRF